MSARTSRLTALVVGNRASGVKSLKRRHHLGQHPLLLSRGPLGGRAGCRAARRDQKTKNNGAETKTARTCGVVRLGTHAVAPEFPLCTKSRYPPQVGFWARPSKESGTVRQRRERANVQQDAGSDSDKGGTDQAGDRFRGGHLCSVTDAPPGL